MTKKVKTVIKLNIPGGQATAAPPVGPALGQHGLPIMDFVKAFNNKTANQKGDVLPVIITAYEDRTFSFITKNPPVSEAIKKTLNLKKGSGAPQRDKVGKLSKDQVKKIAEDKIDDLNAKNLDTAIKIVEGTARSMGVDAEK